ncbi:MAG: hypothetical protein Q4D23_03710 [Bacteroidales bacterium]|nr:hypothetical protein [Bacteroidales bacterium]
MIRKYKHLIATALFAVAGAAVAWADPAGDGSAASPWQIGSAADLRWYSDYVRNHSDLTLKNAILTADIDLSSVCNATDGNWQPIGYDSYNQAFSGTFDGQGHTISGLYIHGSAYNMALFRYAKNAVIKDLTLDAVDIVSTSNNIAALVSQATNTTISGVCVKGVVTGNSYVGGICYRLEGGTIEDCRNEATVSATSYNTVGGILGECRGTENVINRCVNTGAIRSNDSSGVGGILGSCHTGHAAVITNCLNTGAIYARRGYAGGMVGSVNSGIVTLNHCLTTGSVESSASNSIGLLSGDTWNGGAGDPDLTIEHCYASTEATLTYNGQPYDNGHNLYGDPFLGTVVKITGSDFVTPEQLASGVVAVLLQDDQATTQWGQNLAAAATMPVPAVDYQVYLNGTVNCKNEFTGTPTNTPGATPVINGHDWSDGLCSVCGKLQAPAFSEGYYLIGNAGQLAWFRDFVNSTSSNTSAKAKLTADIDLSPVCSAASGQSWTPIRPSTAQYYSGTFDGQGHAITGLYINSTDSYRGLFGCLEGTVQDLTLTCDVTSTGDKVGGLVGYVNGDCDIHGVTVSGSVRGNECVGGIVGDFSPYATNPNGLSDATNHASIEGVRGYVGGIVGYNNSGKICRVVNTGTVHNTSTDYGYVGGIAGYNDGSVTDAFNSGRISNAYSYSQNNLGGIVGANLSRGAISYCLNIGDIAAQSKNNLYGVGLVAGGTQDGTIANNCYSLSTAQLTSKGEVFERDNRLTSATMTTTTIFTLREATPEQLASGEVAYYLQDAQTEGRDARTFWGQIIGSETMPSIQSNNQVYLNGTINCDGSIAGGAYTNTPTSPTVVPHNFAANGVCTACHQGEEPAEDGGVLKISKPGHLVWFRDQIDRGHSDLSAVQTADIDLSTVCSAELGSWIPNSVAYRGTYDGQSHKITGLYCNGNMMYKTGLFGNVERNGVLRNIDVTGDITVGSGNGVSGILCSYLLGTVEQCVTRGTIFTEGDNVAGISGYANGCTVTDCVNYADITIAGTSACKNVGGVMGDCMQSCKVTCCTNYGTITATGSMQHENIGGVVAYNELNKATISDCTNNGAISIEAGYNVGGILGDTNQGTAVIRCANYAAVSGKTYVGGIVGSTISSVNISACANYAPVVASGKNAAGILGSVSNGISVRHCFNNGSVTSTGDASSAAPIVRIVNVSSYTVSDCYYNAAAWTGADDCEGTACTADDIASGRVAYLLGEPFGQELGVDTYPVLGHRPVYYGRYEQCGDIPVGTTDQYSNSVLFADGPHHDYGIDRHCSLCSAEAPVYDFIVNGDDWMSDNQGKGSTDSKKEVDWNGLKAGAKVSFDWTVDSEANYDKLTVTFYVKSGGSYARVVDMVDHVSGRDKSGHADYTITADGDYRLTMTYHKDGGGDSGSDTATLTGLKLVLAKPYADGNIDGDSDVDLDDVNFLQQIILGATAPTVMCDVNNDGRVTIADLTLLIKSLLP